MSDEERPPDNDNKDGYLFGPDGEGWKEEDSSEDQTSENSESAAEAESEEGREIELPEINPMMLVAQTVLLSNQNQHLRNILALQNQIIALNVRHITLLQTELEMLRKRTLVFCLALAVVSFLVGGLVVFLCVAL